MAIFNAQRMTDEITDWIRAWFKHNGPECPAVVGISGGKDSSVTAALCMQALGKDRVIGVLMPNGFQKDIADSYKICSHLGIKSFVVPINATVKDVEISLEDAGIQMGSQAAVNLPARLRMATLYAVSQSLNGRVANTCNLSEEWVGYSTRYGDAAGDFCPLARLTATEVKVIGAYLGLPEKLIQKAPSDGLNGACDEENLGFTYAVLDEYIRTGTCLDAAVKKKIDGLHQKNLFKLRMPFCYDPALPIVAELE